MKLFAKSVLIVYHETYPGNGCPDGLAAVYALMQAWELSEKYNEENIKFLGMSNGKAGDEEKTKKLLKEAKGNQNIYIVDVLPPLAALKTLITEGHHLTIYEHHPSIKPTLDTLQQWQKNKYGNVPLKIAYTEAHSAAIIAWINETPEGTEIPQMLQVISAADRSGMVLNPPAGFQEATAYIDALLARDNLPKAMQQLHHIGKTDFAELIMQGKPILTKLRQKEEHDQANIIWMGVDIHKNGTIVPVPMILNVEKAEWSRWVAFIKEIDYDPKAQIVLLERKSLEESPEEIYISVVSIMNPELFSAADIASNLASNGDGGGHRFAAAFRIHTQEIQIPATLKQQMKQEYQELIEMIPSNVIGLKLLEKGGFTSILKTETSKTSVQNWQQRLHQQSENSRHI